MPVVIQNYTFYNQLSVAAPEIKGCWGFQPVPGTVQEDGGRFLLVGQTDKKGSDAYNLKLSKERAASVVAALDARGVDINALKSVGIGEQNAKVAESASDAERKADRKVTVRYIGDDSEWNKYQKSDVVAPAKKATKKATKKAPAKKKAAAKKKK
jgi:outer membrane protein OmpA-like peptidoglycan-associated protein